MSRMLSELLGAREPDFRLNLQQLERAAGRPSADIRLTAQISADTKAKIRALGLDPSDTTGPELYAALCERFLADEDRVRSSLGLDRTATATDVLRRIKTLLERTELPTDAFVIKPTAMRQILKKLAPKATMKRLGYRSLDSMLKHEPTAQLFAAVWLAESKDWHKQLLKAYEKLTPSDFEVRPVSFYLPTAKHWPKLAQAFVSEQKHNILCIRELGSVVILPIGRDLPGLAITTLLLAMEDVNEIRSQSSFLKLQQVRPDFGQLLKQATLSEPLTKAELAGQPLPWKVIQRFYGRGEREYHPDVLEPHVQREDLTWHEGERVLAGLHQALEFWQGSQMLGLLDGSRPVSCNLLDVALAACNRFDYPQRIVHFMQENLWHELMGKYLHQENLEQMVLGKLNDELVPEPVPTYDEINDISEITA